MRVGRTRSLYKDLDQLSTPTPLPAMRRMTLPGTHLRPVESANAMSRSRPVALTKSPKKCMMRYDRSSVTLAMKSEVHGASVAQVPANATRTRPRPSSTAQSRRPHAAPSKSIKAAHLPPMPPKKAAAGSASTVPSGQPQHRQHSSNTCQLPRGARQKLCIYACWRGVKSSRIG